MFVSRLEMWADGGAQENEQQSVQARNGADQAGGDAAQGQTCGFRATVARWWFSGESAVFAGRWAERRRGGKSRACGLGYDGARRWAGCNREDGGAGIESEG